MKKRLLILSIFLASLISINAQEISLTGRVISEESGNGIPGISVQVKGTKKGVITDASGNFSIKAAKGDILVFSGIGFASKELAVTDASMEVTLTTTAGNLGEVVVVGYGTQKKANLTGSLVTLDNAVLNKRQVASTSNLIQGLAPGVSVQQQSGKPGADGAGISVRGLSSFGGSNAPLIIVDGLAVGGLDQIDPNAIESITILKDAASTSIYGNRGSAGVILVKTKRAVKKGLQVSYNAFFTKQQATSIPNRVSAIDHMELSNIAERNRTGNPAAIVFQQALIDKYKTTAPNNLDVIDTDWLDLLLTNNGLLQNHNVQLSSGGERVNVFASVSYLKQQGLTPNNSFEKYDVRFNPEFKINDKFTLSGIFSYNKSTTVNPSTGSSEFIIRQAIGLPAIGGGKYGPGLYGTAGQSNNRNPLAMAEAAGTSVVDGNTLLTRFGFNYRPVNGLDIEAYWAREQRNPTTKTFVKNVDIYQPNIATQGYDKITVWPGTTSLSESYRNDVYQNYLAQATYSFKINDHSFKVLAGAQNELFKNYFFGASRTGFINPDQPFLNLGSGVRDNNAGASELALLGVFGRINYNYQDKYLLELNGRRDASSRFSQERGNQWGSFGSASIGWVFTRENFLGKLSNYITFGKIRASIGGNGNQNIGSNYGFDAFYAPANYTNNLNGTNAYFNNVTTLGVALLDFPNPDLSWETSRQWNVGIDLTLLNSLTITADYYVRSLISYCAARFLHRQAGSAIPL
jgi:TonB-linked SusC/RagA family outer membrane protein